MTIIFEWEESVKIKATEVIVQECVEQYILLLRKFIRCLKFFKRMINQRTARQAMRYAFRM